MVYSLSFYTLQAAKRQGSSETILIEGLFVTKPKTAIVAILDEKIIGGFVYQIDIIGKKKIGFVSFLFTDPAYQGYCIWIIGSRLNFYL